MPNNNLPAVYKNTLPAKIKKAMTKTGKIIGSSAALFGSIIGTGISAAAFPPLVVPLSALALYSGNKLANNTYYTAFKDLAFVGRKHKNNIKIFQDVIRPDISSELMKMDTREKLAFLQLQALVGITKFDRLGKDGMPITIETDSHGMIRKTFQKLNELGYIENYEENFIKKSHLILPKLAFGNTKLGKDTEIYNMKFQKSEKEIDFDDPKFKAMFPMVFSKRGLISKTGYNLKRGENGEIVIDYNKKERSKRRRAERKLGKNEQNIKIEKHQESEKQKFREELSAGLSLEEQREFVQKTLEENKERQEGSKERGE